MENFTIRIAHLEDLDAITKIYNQAVLRGFQTADISVFKTEERLAWFKSHAPDKFPVFVAELNGILFGWLSISPYRPGREALRFTAEISFYIHQEYQQKGIGSALLRFAIEFCSKLQYKTLIAIVLERNAASISFLKKSGFHQWGFLPGVADFTGEECGHFYFGFTINTSD